MHNIRHILDKYELHPTRYQVKGKVTFVDTDRGQFAMKEMEHDQEEIWNYLRSRNFLYYPEIIRYEDHILVTKKEIDISMPREQKAEDLIDLMALLHHKTTHYKEIDISDYKELYEDISNNIFYLKTYYDDIMSVIESHTIMSPSEYLLARNISRIFISLNFCKEEIENWYELIKDKTKQRVVVLHNNLDLSHFFKMDSSYLISWDKSKIGIPIFDLYILYKRHALDFDFSEVLRQYEQSYPLQKEERQLFFILIALPPKIDFDKSIYEQTKEISNQMDIMYKTERLISPYYSK